MSHVRSRLHRGDLVAIDDYRCSAPHGRGRDEEVSPAWAVVLPRRGAFVRRDRAGRHVADPTRVVLFAAGETYTVDHPAEGGDRCTVLGFAEPVLRAADVPFDRRIVAGSATVHLAHRALLGAVRSADAVRIDESALALLAAVALGGRAPDRGASENARYLAAEAEAVLATAFRERVTVAGLADRVGVSPFHLCRTFRSVTGDTIHGRLTDLRLRAALEDLPRRGRRLSELALEVGFSSHSHFTAAFRRRYGRVPSSLTGSSG